MNKRIGTAAALLSAALIAGLSSGQAQAASPQRLQVSNVTASSTLASEPGYNYDVWNIVDHDPSTCWTEGVQGDGVGEYIDIYIPKGTVVTGALVYPGYYIDKNRFDKNGAPTMLTFSSNGTSVDQYMTSYATDYQDGFEGCYFNLTTPFVSDGKVRVKIGKVRTGTRYQDTCISELYLYGYTDTAGSDVNEGYDNSDWDTVSPENGTISENEFAQYSELGKQLLAPIWDGEESIALKADALTSSQRAMALYWYQYNCSDVRINEGSVSNKFSYEDAAGILTDLFGDQVRLDQDLRVFMNNYIENFDGRRFTVSSVGDFGDAGEWYLSEPVFEGTYDGSIVLSGSVMRYSAGSNQYTAEKKYMIYLSEQGTNRSGSEILYSFREIDIL